MNELEKADLIQSVAQLYMQGKKETEIAREKSISPSTVKSYIKQWEEWIKDKAQENPELFDRVLENTILFLENYDFMLKNAWEVHDDAKLAAVASTRLQALKLIQELNAQKARLYQLLGPRVDNNYLEKSKRAERINELLSDILRRVVSGCERCMPLVWEDLQEAYKSAGVQNGEVGELESN